MSGFDEWWETVPEDEKSTMSLIEVWAAAIKAAREVVDDELNCFMSEAPPGYWNKQISETVEALRGQLDRALQARGEDI